MRIDLNDYASFAEVVPMGASLPQAECKQAGMADAVTPSRKSV